MRPIVIAALCFVAAGCTTAPEPDGGIRVPTSNDYLLLRNARPIARNAPDFCRQYGQRTANNRLRNSSSSRGRGPAGFDFYLAKDAGERAAERCREGRPG